MTESTRHPDEVQPLGLVLVVDDEELVRRVVARQLIRAGYSVREAGSGAEALEALENLSEEERDLLRATLLDLSMPGLKGPDLLAQVKALHPEMPVVILSGHVEDESLLKEASAVLQKPILGAELLRVISEVTKN
jgi:CheY-like chemotaxis protein